MQYKFSEKFNYEDFSSGRFLYHMPGGTNFPVRLAYEIFKRCLSHIENKDNVCIYDPCCGEGYLLTVLGFLNMHLIKYIVGSDINQKAVETAVKNINLLSIEGILARINELKTLHEKYGKNSHLEALETGKRLLSLVLKESVPIDCSMFYTNILDKNALSGRNFKADIVITDIPYGNMTKWEDDNEHAVDILLNNIRPVLKKDSVVAICSDKKQKFNGQGYFRLEKQQIGKRKFEIFKNVFE